MTPTLTMYAFPSNAEQDLSLTAPQALKAREKQRPSFQVTMSSKKAGEAGSGRNITSPAVKSTSNSSLSSLSSSSKAAVKDGQRKKKEVRGKASGAVLLTPCSRHHQAVPWRAYASDFPSPVKD